VGIYDMVGRANVMGLGGQMQCIQKGGCNAFRKPDVMRSREWTQHIWEGGHNMFERADTTRMGGWR
jgi:hypothetical protein